MPRLAYILAASHSGSTLLAMLLGAQPGACTAGELKANLPGTSYRCSCREPIGNCAFWREVSSAMAARGIDGFEIGRAGTSIYDVGSRYARRLLAPLHRGRTLEAIRDAGLALSADWRRTLAETSRRNRALVEVLAEVTGAEVVVDSSKVALRLKYLLRSCDLDIRVIRVIRDGRAVSLTYTDEWTFADASEPELRGGGTGERRPPPRRSIREGAREWRRSNEASDALLAGLPASKWLAVRYEDLCADPAGALRRIARFLDLDDESLVLDFRGRPQHVIGNGMRMDSGSEISLDERWKSCLTPSQLAEFEATAGDLNRAYGYC